LYCGRSYRPDPRTAVFQKSCRRDRCRRERRRRKSQSWRKRHPDHHKSQSSRNKTVAWAKTYPDYWKCYRAKNGDYRERERRRMNAKRRRNRRVAKATAITEIAVERLKMLQPHPGRRVAKRTAITRRMDAVVAYLIWRESVAKRTDMAVAPSGAG